MADPSYGVCHLDHLVVAAPSLEEGSVYLEALLGVQPSPGGKHATQATHNRLLRLGDRVYLELIAIDPGAPAPPRARWFALDDPHTQERIAQRPRLITWVARTESLPDAPRVAGFDFGAVHSLQRGEYRWRITLTPDGALLHDGVMPALIQWLGPHPAQALPESGCSLLELECRSAAYQEAAAVLHRLKLDGAVRLSAPAHPGQTPLRAVIETPIGVRVID